MLNARVNVNHKVTVARVFIRTEARKHRVGMGKKRIIQRRGRFITYDSKYFPNEMIKRQKLNIFIFTGQHNRTLLPPPNRLSERDK
jgi:hypothetical protein